MRKKEKMEKSKYWRRNDGFLFEPEVKVTLLIDSPMVFFSGVSMRGGWIIRNVFLLVSDSMQYFFSKKGTKWRARGNLNEQQHDRRILKKQWIEMSFFSKKFDRHLRNNNKWKTTLWTTHLGWAAHFTFT